MKQVSLDASPQHLQKTAAFGDPAWATLKTATPAQIDAYLTNNVVTLADARRVLRTLIMAMRYLVAQQ